MSIRALNSVAVDEELWIQMLIKHHEIEFIYRVHAILWHQRSNLNKTPTYYILIYCSRTAFLVFFLV